MSIEEDDEEKVKVAQLSFTLMNGSAFEDSKLVEVKGQLNQAMEVI